ncbi:hypothetical protein LCGC14_0545850 [marine sediment metagenome]|uniref:Novel STAND NTPase 3 domain-containing protein n=1 Tax=marine sediment metagenome TaxID=412755 RepID=A0A0F9RRC3_9ZZZZ
MTTLINYYIPSEIKQQLDNSKKIVMEADQDRIFIITGREGSGKSWLAMQLAAYLDNTFCLDDVCFDSDSFGKRIKRVNKLKAIVFDEAFTGLSSKGALSKENKKLIKILIECRQRNLFLFIVLPSIFILDRYITLFRSHSLFNTAISRKDFKNRYYKVYNYQNKHKLYILGQKYMSYAKPKIWKKYRFYGKLPSSISKEGYQKKKTDSFKEKEVQETPELTRMTGFRNIAIYEWKKVSGMTNKELSNYYKSRGYDLSESYIAKIIQKVRKEYKI